MLQAFLPSIVRNNRQRFNVRRFELLDKNTRNVFWTELSQADSFAISSLLTLVAKISRCNLFKWRQED